MAQLQHGVQLTGHDLAALVVHVAVNGRHLRISASPGRVPHTLRPVVTLQIARGRLDSRAATDWCCRWRQLAQERPQPLKLLFHLAILI
jgi:hypothetical protein